jgi:hypothetical protein
LSSVRNITRFNEPTAGHRDATPHHGNPLLTEPDVSLTDYALAAESALFVHLLYFRNRPASHVRMWFALLFASLGLASLSGGTVHGFFLDQARRLPDPVAGDNARYRWRQVRGVAGRRRCSAGPGARPASWVSRPSQFVAYAGVVLASAHDFSVAVMNYLPASIFLLALFAVSCARRRAGRVLVGLVGIVSTLIAAGVQQAGLALHPLSFNHNALYHLIQGMALSLIFSSVPVLAAAQATKRPPC